MNIVTNSKNFKKIRENLNTESIGFVPTMGNLHVGHMALCERSKKENDITVVSIFVNPMQFNQLSDLEAYPRTLEQDCELLKKYKVDYLFLPEYKDIYSDHYEIKISESEISKLLEGEYRPGHFDGMLTIVLKLLNIISANNAYFGEKDYQQLLLVKKMAEALFIRTHIIGCETMRAEDGLALSSRNSRLNESQRKLAAEFPKLLSSQNTIENIKETLQLLGFKVDYIAEKWDRRLGAVWLDQIRLIDNIKIG